MTTPAFKAPDGRPIIGLVQCTYEAATWPTIWPEGATAPEGLGNLEYVADGPAPPDWETVRLDNEGVWEAEGGETWLTRHLIAAERPSLSGEVCKVCRADLDAHLTLMNVRTLAASASDEDACCWGLSMIERDAVEKAARAKEVALYWTGQPAVEAA